MAVKGRKKLDKVAYKTLRPLIEAKSKDRSFVNVVAEAFLKAGEPVTKNEIHRWLNADFDLWVHPKLGPGMVLLDLARKLSLGELAKGSIRNHD